MRLLAGLCLWALFVGGCASYDGRGLKLGVSHINEVQRIMGQPAMRWLSPAGGEQMAFPRGPAGFHTFMVVTDRQGILQSIENVLAPEHFARLRQGMNEDQVLQILGPPFHPWTIYFEARDELVWEWRYCDDYLEPARFNVLFDKTSGTLRSSMSRPERSIFSLGRERREFCSR